MDFKMKILVVDDMATIRKIVSKMLGELGYSNVDVADNKHPAWELIQQAQTDGKPYHFIISDWNMPGMTGIDLLRKVRGDTSVKKTKFLMLTAETEKENIVEAIKAGVSDYTIKPFNKDILKGKLDRLFGA